MSTPAQPLRISEAATLLGVSIQTVRRWADANRIPVIKTPTGHRRFFAEDLKPYMPTRTPPT